MNKKSCMRVEFPEGNNIAYGQDFSWHCGVPSGVVFEVEDTENYYILTAHGYGALTKNGYGNGALYVGKGSTGFNIKNFECQN